MANLVNLESVSHAFGTRVLLDGVSLGVGAGEVIGVVGRNGDGKTTLLRVLTGDLVPDSGRVTISNSASIGVLTQHQAGSPGETIRQVVLDGAADHVYAARADRREIVEALLAGVDLDRPVETLSGGERRRVGLVEVLLGDHDLIVLDEPTNHLDIEAIEALEAIVNAGPAAIIITHDRRFLDQVATRIIELDRGLVRSFPGNFATYEKVRGEQLEAEAVANRKFDKFWAQEEVWIRKGIEARRTRNEGRVRRLEALREARAARRERTGQIRLEVDAGERSGKLVCETCQAGISLGGRCLVRDLDLTIMRGDRIGLIGPNGIGKSTLLKLILGEYPPDTGSVRLGSNLQIAYFDQLREQLDPEQSVANTVSPGSEYVEINGVRRHIMSYLQDFLFPSNRANSPVRTLSGGERNRLLLARLFARPANLLVLDEPTNDLDLESIDLLESMLQSYPGTLLLVSHDRRFLDNVVTSVLVAQGDGHWLELVGGYSDWLAWRQTQPNQAPSGFGAAVIASSSGQAGAEGSDTANRAASASGAQAADAAGASSASAGASVEAAKPRGGRLTLSNREVRDLANLPGEIETLEAEIAADQARMNEPDFFRQPPEQIKDFQTALADKEQKVLDMMTRWEELLEKEAQVNASRGR